MPVIRKVQSKVKKATKEEPLSTEESEAQIQEGRAHTLKAKKKCPFCQSKTEPSYIDSTTLKKFISDRGRITNRLRGGVCAKHQRRITTQIKRARHLALLPFIIRI